MLLELRCYNKDNFMFACAHFEPRKRQTYVYMRRRRRRNTNWRL